MRLSPVLACSFILACGTSEVVSTTSPPKPMPMPDPELPVGPLLPMDPTNPSDPGFTPAPHPGVPALTSQSGPIMGTPRLVLITFEGDPMRDDLETFITKLATSSWWTQTVGEYGVAAPTATFAHAPEMTSGTKLDDPKVNQFFTENLGPGGLLGAWDPNAVYVLALPSGVGITTTIAGLTGQGCLLFGGFHSETVVNGQTVVFAAVPRCGTYPPPPLHTLSGLPLVTYTLAHELVEAVTDPHPMTEPGFLIQRDLGAALGLALGPENADLCVMIDSPEVEPQDLGFTVTRAWSNLAAAGGHDPCVPAPARPYFNVAALQMPDTITVPDPYDLSHKRLVQTQGLKLAPGESKTLTLSLYSDAPTGPWTIDAVNAGLFPALSFKFSKTSGSNGDVVDLTLTRSSLPVQGDVVGFVVRSALDGVENDWFGLVAK